MNTHHIHPWQKGQTLTLSIRGLNIKFGTDEHLRSALKSISGVTDVFVNADSGHFCVFYDAESFRFGELASTLECIYHEVLNRVAETYATA